MKNNLFIFMCLIVVIGLAMVTSPSSVQNDFAIFVVGWLCAYATLITFRVGQNGS